MPGVEQELSPGNCILCGLDVALSQLFTFLDCKASINLHPVLTRVVSSICVAPDKQLSVENNNMCQLTTYMQEWLSNAWMG